MSDSVTVRRSTEDHSFEVSMVRKVYTIKAESDVDCVSWMKVNMFILCVHGLSRMNNNY
jgi:hypothetical protein